MSAPPQPWSREDYERAAREYCDRLPPEHYMEATPQATQRKITLASFAALNGRVPGLHLFNELLVQEFVKGQLRQVVPDNMVVLGELEPRERTYYCPEEEGHPVFWALEYVSPNTRRKDYVRNREVYEKVLRVPYYLIFDPDRELAMLLRLREGQYAMAEQGPETERYRLPELEMELGLVDGWVRFWHKGALVPLPAELVAQAERLAKRLEEERLRREKAEAVVTKRDEQLAERDELLAAREELLAAREELLAARDELLAARDELLVARDEELTQSREELTQSREELTQSREELQLRLEELQQATDLLRQSDDEKKLTGEQLKQAADRLNQLEKARQDEAARSDGLAVLLRSLLEPKARLAGRQDILARLPTTVDADTLQRWMAELGNSGP